jgi:acetoacetyl-CoA reductase
LRSCAIHTRPRSTAPSSGSRALQAAGYTGAANYAGDDEAAAKFKEATGIPVYKWDVLSYKLCVDGLQKVTEDLGPIDILVNNAGITRDTLFYKIRAVV